MKTLHLLIVIAIISFCIVSVNQSYSLCMGTFQPNIQKDNGMDTEGYHTYLASINDNQTYPIKYKISSGAVIEAISSETPSPILNIIVREVSQGGNLTIQLPTKLLGLYSIGGYSVAEGAMCADIIGTSFPTPIESNLNFTTVEFPLMNYSGVDEMIYITGNYQQPSTTSESPSPLKQFKSGTSLEDITCKDGLFLAISNEKTPMCLQSGTISKLASRGLLYGAKQDSETTILIPPGSEDPASNKTYSPDNATVVIGINSTVTWVNQADVGNSIASDTPVVQNLNTFGGSIARPGDSYRYTFTEPGVFHYHGEPHPWQKGIINVISIPIPANLTSQQQSNTMSILENSTGIVTLGNQTYYFETPNYTEDAYFHPVQISFHDVIFTLFPSGFRGGLPINGCGGVYYWTDAKFRDNTHELLHIFSDSPPCTTIPIMFSNHTNPQAGLTFYDEKMKLLVSTGVNSTSTTNVQTLSNSTDALRLDLSADSQIIQSGQSLGIDVSVNNTLPAQVKLSNVNAWAYSDLNLDPCIPRPFGIAVFDGYYTEQNMTDGKPLLLFNPDALCPAINATQSYVFEPLSTHATVSTCTDSSLPSCSYSQDMKDHVSISGYWNQGQLYPFKSGIYTLVGGDEWGHVLMQHFAVTNSTIFAGNLGGMSCPAFQFGIDTKIKNATGFSVLSSSLHHDNLALDAGKTGTLDLEYNYSHATIGPPDLVGKPLNITNYGMLTYVANVTSTKPITQYEVTLSPDTPWQPLHVCHYNPQFGGQETPCFPDQYNTVSQIGPGPIPYRPGISVDVEPKWIMVDPNSTSIFTATISTNKTALSGSYWVIAGRGLCGPSDLIELVIK